MKDKRPLHCECGYVSYSTEEFFEHETKCPMIKAQQERERIQEIMDGAGEEFHRCKDYKL